MKAVIFAGGVGSRLWPISRKKSPKQFEKIVDNKSTLELTYDRVAKKLGPIDIYVSTGKQYSELMHEALPNMPKINLIVEPQMRDVGPAVGLVTALFAKEYPKEPMLILWGDHHVKQEQVFLDIIEAADELVKKNPKKMVFIGQKARFANQNLGWIQMGKKAGNHKKVPYYTFNSLKYRPSQQEADIWYSSDNYCWNLGYFVVQPEHLWNLFKEHAPEMYEKLKKIQDVHGTKNFEKVLEDIYPTLEKINFDNIILEKLTDKDAYVLYDEFGWSDLGAWDALKEALQEKTEDTLVRGDVMIEGVTDSIVYNYDDKTLIVGIDLKDMVVVHMQDAVFIAPKKSASKIKNILERMNGTKYEELM